MSTKIGNEEIENLVGSNSEYSSEYSDSDDDYDSDDSDDYEKWDDIKTYEQFKNRMLEFIRGDIYSTPDHGGPLNEESNIILDKLIHINKLSYVTLDSQPFREDIRTDGLKRRQRPYIDFIIPMDETLKFIKLLFEKRNNIAIVQQRHGECILHLNNVQKNERGGFSCSQIFKDGEWIEENNTNLWYDLYGRPEFKGIIDEILEDEYDQLDCICMDFDNGFFDDIISVLGVI